MIIEKKVWPEYFQNILDGKKNFEVRLDDFKCSKGDTLLLKEWDPKTKEYTGRQIEKTVSIVVKLNELDFWSKAEIDKFGYQVIGF
jgi:hypothetical protein